MNRNYTVYAVDFDGTLCESVFPRIGSPNLELINHLIKRRKQGNKIILWTCRVGERLQEAVKWCRGYGLEFDAVNENLPELIELFGNDCRKVSADVYIDDKAVNKSKYHIPFQGPTVNMMIGDKVIVKKFSSRSAYGKEGTVKKFDTDVQPGELFAVLDIAGTEYCFNVKDLAVVSE